MSLRIPRTVSLVVSILAHCLPTVGQGTEPARLAAMSVCEKVQISPNAPDNWTGASVESVQSITSPKGKWQVARLAKDAKDAGYVLLSETTDSLVPVMYSASKPPAELIAHLAAPGGGTDFDSAPQIESLSDVTMIAVPKLRGDRAQVTPLACCVASMCMWVQEHHRIPLQYLPLDAFPAKPLDLDSSFVLPSPPPAAGELTEYQRAKAEVFSDPELFEPLPAAAGTQPALAPPPGSRKGLKASSLQFDLSERLRPLTQTALAKNLSRPARWEMMREEFIQAGQLLPEPFGARIGTVSAIVIQRYLWNAASPEQGLEAFARAHGLRSVWSYSNLADLTPQKLPCVLCGPGNQAVLAIGLTSDSESRYAVLVIPETVQPLERSNRELVTESVARIRAVQAAGGPEAAKLSPILHTPEIDRKVDEELQKGSSPYLQGTTKWDPPSKTPVAFGLGAHVVRLEALDGWKVLSIELSRGG